MTDQHAQNDTLSSPRRGRAALEQDTATQAKLLGIVHNEAGSTQEMKTA